MKIKILGLFCFLTIIATGLGQNKQPLKASLNGYKYVFVPTIKYADGSVDRFGVIAHLRQFFVQKGFIVLMEGSTPPQEVQNDPCLLLNCSVEHSTGALESSKVTITLMNCNREVVFSNTAKSVGWAYQDAADNAVKKAFAPIYSFPYKYDASATPAFNSPEVEKTSETEESIRAYLTTSHLDPIEGIYNSYQDTGIPYYKLGIINRDGKFKAIIIESSQRAWKPGEVKATFESSSMKGLYAVKWFMADKTHYETFGTMENEGVLSIELKNPQTGEKRQDKFVKMFPPVSGDSATKPEGSKVAGSGFFVSTTGIIATNAHVVEAARNVEVTISNEIGTFVYKAKVLLADGKNDVALIQIDDDKFKGLTSIPYGFIEKADAGERVFTIGYPLNDVMGNNYKVNDGIISSKSGVADDIRYFQISVPLQPGNSGGPLFNKDGNIIGLTSAKLNSKAVGAEVENVNYAIKASYLINLYNMLPDCAKLNSSSQVAAKPLQEQVKILKNYVCLITSH
jgi:S1-C subfamily serine protease